MNDNASKFCSKAFRDTLQQLRATQIFIHARPATDQRRRGEGAGNDPVEEYWSRPGRDRPRYLIARITGLQPQLKAYLRYYNYDRAHTGRWTSGCTPAQVLAGGNMYP